MKRRRMQLAFALFGLVSLGLPRCVVAQTQADTASVQAFYREWFGSVAGRRQVCQFLRAERPTPAAQCATGARAHRYR